MSGRRIALVLAFANYRTAPPLPTGIADTRALQRALADPQIGRFDRVDAQFDLPRALVQEHVQAFLAAGQKDDLVLLYIAGHMGLDTTGRFTIAAANAEDMQGTDSIDGAWLEENLNRCVSKRVVLILDGRNSGAFGESIRARTGFDVSTTRDLAGPERVVLASAGISDLADTQVSKGDTPASFTDIVVRGITGGAADIDGDGTVNVFELFEYAQKESARYFAARQQPLLRMFGGAPASIIIAYTTHEHNQQTSLGTAGLPDDLLSAVESTSITARQQAFWRLCALLLSPDNATKSQALLALYELLGDRDTTVRELARTRLALGEQFADRVLAAGAQAIQNRKSYEPPDWSLIGVSDRRGTRQVEVYVEGDFNWNSGSMRGSQVGGRENQNKLRYKEIRAAVDAPQTVAELREALGELASEVGSADLDFREKAAALTALGWWQDNIDVPVEPDDAQEYASVLHRAGGWIWGRFAGLINDMPAALVAAWVFEVVKHFAVG